MIRDADIIYMASQGADVFLIYVRKTWQAVLKMALETEMSAQ